MYEVQISITGERIEAEAVKEVFTNFLRLLRAIEGQVATKKGAVRWRLQTLRYASPVVIAKKLAGSHDRRGAKDVLLMQMNGVAGLVRRDKSGQPREISVREFVPVEQSSDYVSIAGIAPDFTDGVESAKYIKDRWQ